MQEQELENILAAPESDLVERTENGKDLDKIGKAICAFANDNPGHGRPGVVVVGMKDDGSCAGLEINDRLITRLSNLKDEGMVSPSPQMSVQEKDFRGCSLAVIVVEPSNAPPVRYKGDCWIRVGASTRRASADDERALTEKRADGDLPFDQREARPTADLDADFNLPLFKGQYLPNAVSQTTLAENRRDIESQLASLRFLSRADKPNYAAILCFAHDPIKWLQGAYIQFIRFAGGEITSSIKNQKRIHGDIFAQIRAIEELLEINISEAMSIGGPRHIVKPDYPIEALRQYIRNAIMHRDYESGNAPIRVYWLNDRVEIHSPGGLYGTLRRESFPDGRQTAYRNPTLAEALQTMGYVEQFGFGIPKAELELRKNGNPVPEFEVQDHFFAVIIRPANE